MRLRFAGVVPVLVRDTYVRGQGRMLGRMLMYADFSVAPGDIAFNVPPNAQGLH